MKNTNKNSQKHLTPLKAIRQKCLNCSNRQPKEVRFCQATECPLFVYRFGKNPKRRGVYNKNNWFCRKHTA